MKKILFAFASLLFLTACTSVENQPPQSAPSMTEPEARQLAEQSCIKGGEALSAGEYNASEGAWTFAANLNSDTAECKSWCLVEEKSGIAQMDRKCE